MSFPRYSSYQESGAYWLGDVPSPWILKRLGFYFRERREKVSDKDFAPLSVTMQGIVPRIDTAAKSDDGDNRKKVCAGDFVINSRSDRKGSAGVSQLTGSVSLISIVLEPQEATFRPFIHHLLRSVNFQEEFYRYGKGIVADLWSTNYSEMRNIQLAMPPHEEQVRIADFLDRETAKIDELVAEQRRLIELLRERIVSLALSPSSLGASREVRLGHAFQIISRPVTQLDGQLYTTLGLYNRGRGLFHKEPRVKDEMGDSDFFWVEAGDLIISGQFAWEGAVAIAGPAEAGCVVSHRYPVLRGRPEIALTEYLYALLITEHGDFLLNENSRGAAGRNRPLNISSMIKDRIPLPSMKIQESVAAAIGEFDEARTQINFQIALLQERRTALVSAAVTGKIDVRGLAATEAG